MPLLPILLLAAAIYLNSFPGAFHYDDYGLFLENPAIREGMLQPLALPMLYGGRPLTLLSLELNFRLCGEDPACFHLVNLLIHLGATSLVFILATGFSSSPLTAPLAALIFAVHPLQAQAVDYTWSRSMLLMAFFLLASVAVTREGKSGWLGPALFQLAIWSRMDALAALPLLIYLNRNRKLPIGILGVLNLAAACYSLFAAGNPGTAWSHDAPLRFIMEAPLNLLRYLDLMFLPGGYSIFHAYPEAGFLRISASAGSAALIIFAAWRIRKKLPPAAAGTAWLILMLLPSLLIPNPDPVNESRAYAAFAGAALLAASLLAAAGNSAGRLLSTLVSRAGSYRNSTLTGAAAVLVSFACLPPLALITIERNHAWNSDILIWQEAVSMNPGVHLPVYNLGVALIRNGEIEKGCESLLEAIKLNPRDDMSYSAAGYCYELMGERDRARAYYSRALEINPENNTARDLIGTPGRIETKK